MPFSLQIPFLPIKLPLRCNSTVLSHFLSKIVIIDQTLLIFWLTYWLRSILNCTRVEAAEFGILSGACSDCDVVFGVRNKVYKCIIRVARVLAEFRCHLRLRKRLCADRILEWMFWGRIGQRFPFNRDAWACSLNHLQILRNCNIKSRK